MKKCPIGFNSTIKEDCEVHPPIAPYSGKKEIKKSVVQVYFSSADKSFAYYNDSFDLKAGDFVYVEGVFEGVRGQVTEVSYSYKIKLSDYKKVIAVCDTSVNGDFYFAGSHLVSFNRDTLPYDKALSWFKAPQNDAYEIGDGDSQRFPLSDLSKMKVSEAVAKRGHEYYVENNVIYVCIDGNCGHAIVLGNEFYEIDFNFNEGEIENLKCSCFCSYPCKHEFAAMLQLRETLEFILNNYEDEYEDYFMAINKFQFMSTVLNKKGTGKITLNV